LKYKTKQQRNITPSIIPKEGVFGKKKWRGIKRTKTNGRGGGEGFGGESKFKIKEWGGLPVSKKGGHKREKN